MKFRIPLLIAAYLSMPAAGLAQEREWNFDQTDKDAYLVFGVPETDDVGISLWCTKLSGSVGLFVPSVDSSLKPGKTAKVTLDVNGKRFHYAGKTSDNQEAATTSVEITLKPDDKLFKALEQGDRIAVTAAKTTRTFPLTEADFAAFLDVCRKP